MFGWLFFVDGYVTWIVSWFLCLSTRSRYYLQWQNIFEVFMSFSTILTKNVLVTAILWFLWASVNIFNATWYEFWSAEAFLWPFLYRTVHDISGKLSFTSLVVKHRFLQILSSAHCTSLSVTSEVDYYCVHQKCLT